PPPLGPTAAAEPAFVVPGGTDRPPEVPGACAAEGECTVEPHADATSTSAATSVELRTLMLPFLALSAAAEYRPDEGRTSPTRPRRRGRRPAARAPGPPRAWTHAGRTAPSRHRSARSRRCR